MALVHIYCGDGKGKTSAAVGMAVRAAGRGLKVVMVRFLKSDDSGEVAVLGHIPGITVIPCERTFGFVSAMDRETREQAARWNLEQFFRAVELADARLLNISLKQILDENMAAMTYGMVPEERVLEFLEARPGGLEVVLTGRSPSERILGAADYVSEIQKVRHPYDRGILARKGIEY